MTGSAGAAGRSGEVEREASPEWLVGDGAMGQLIRGKRFRILLAADNADMQDYIVRVIGPEYEVQRAGDGQEAWDSIVGDLPDLLILDVMMPRMDGITLIQKIRGTAETQALPVILLSAGAGEEATAEGIELGADEYLVKPFSPRELRARVRTLLELKTLREEIVANREFVRVADALRESEKLAAVGRLAGSIAHEINNPLEAVTNLIYLATETAADPELKEYLELAQQELERVSKITIQTLRFHRQTITPERADAAEIIESVLALLVARVAKSEISVERQFRDAEQILCRVADLRQVFVNLIQNAVDASHPGGRIVLRVKNETNWRTNEHCVRVSVADTGCGMSEEVRRQIFEPFFTTKELTGTGLGLWVSGEILLSHGASVRVRSRDAGEKTGTIFSILFPVLRSAASGR